MEKTTVSCSNEEMRQFWFGAYSFGETKDGYLQAFQYSQPQMEYFRKTFDFWYDRCMASSAKTLEFITEARRISFDYRIIWEGSQDSIEAAVNGLIADIRYVKDLDKEGTIEFSFPEGKKQVVVYLPADATIVLRNLASDAPLSRPEKNEKVLWLGDSITQGYGPLRSSGTYVSVANRLLNYDIVNQGIGGYIFDKGSLMKMDGYRPDKIIVALGTNQYGTESMKPVEDYFETFRSLYDSRIPVLCITPLWRGDNPDGLPTLARFCSRLKEIAESYDHVTVADGFNLVPHLPEYFKDNLHPNGLGSEVYGRNLVEEIRKNGF